nr:anti-sigma factor [Actinomycetales bacterium]
MHLTDEQFALLTTDQVDSLPAELALHAESCPECRVEVEAYLAVADALRNPEQLQQPPQDVWARIAAELGDEIQGAVSPDVESGPTAAPTTAAPTTAAPTTAAPTTVGDEQTGAESDVAPVVPLRPRGGGSDGRWVRRLTMAAAASFALGVAATAGISEWLNRPQSEMVQAVGLEPLPGWTEEGTATIYRIDGELRLVVDMPETEIDGFREVWLIDRNVERLVSLGAMTGDRGEFTIPDGLDLNEYVIVDVSREHFDGDPTHSGDSIVRGQLS